jgi:hypothetical protein
MIMYVRIVTFTLTDITDEDYQRHAAAVAEAFTTWPGLLGKVWLSDPDRNRYGGIYLFATKADADRSRSTPLFAGLAANPAFTDLAIEEYETLPDATAVTWPGLHSPARPAFAAG